MTIKIGKKYFSGGANVGEVSDTKGLAAVIRGLAIDNARAKLASSQIADFTDNSTGVAAGEVVDLVVPTVAYDATSAGGAQRADFNTIMGVIENATAVVAEHINKLRGRIGLDVMTWAAGTVATSGTIPAMTLSVTTASGTSAVDFAEGAAAMAQAKSNLRKLVRAMNECFVACGITKIDDGLTEDFDNDYAMEDIATAAAAATGASSIAKTVADTFFDSYGDNIASLAAFWNGVMAQAGLSDLTDSSGGSASGTLAAPTVPTPAAGAATTSSPKAGFDTVLGVIENNLSEICTRMNALRLQQGLAAYTDSTGQSVNGTLESQSVDLTAVDGSSGTSAVEPVSGLARLATIRNAITSLGTGINELAPYYGVNPLTILTGGVASTTIANIAATDTGVGGADTLLDTEVDAYLVVIRNSISSLAAKLNAMTGTEASQYRLSVVAVE